MNRRRIGLTLLIALASACDGGGGNTQAGSSGGGGSGGNGATRCIDPLPLDCAASSAPTFAAFHQNQLRSTCSSGGALCHGDGAQSGLELADPDGAYDALLGLGGGRVFVVPGEPECSVLVQRLESDDPDTVMPVGNQLPEGVRCAVRQWIANGADR